MYIIIKNKIRKEDKKKLIRNCVSTTLNAIYAVKLLLTLTMKTYSALRFKAGFP